MNKTNQFVRSAFLFAAFFFASRLLAATGNNAQILTLPVAQWQVEKADNTTVTLAAQNELLAIDYDTEISQIYRVGGYKTIQESRFMIRLSHPVTIAKDQARITFESRSTAGQISIRPVIEDQNKEKISYLPELVDTFATRSDALGWQRWRSHPFYMTEAGGEAISIYEATGGDQNAWPDGKLQFIGFEIRIAKSGKGNEKSPSRQKGRIYLADVSLDGIQNLQADTSFAYADALMNEAGNYQLSFETRAAFQGPPVHDESRIVSFDPTDEKSRKTKITLPDADLRNGWIRYRIARTDLKNPEIKEKTIRSERNTPPTMQNLPAVDASTPPAVGLVRIDPDTRTDVMQVGGLHRDANLNTTIRIFPPVNQKNKLTLQWFLEPFGYSETLSSGACDITPSDQQRFVDVTLPLQGSPNRDAYSLRYEISADGKLLDRGDYLLGIARDTITPRTTRQGNIPDRNDIKSRAYFRTTFLQPGNIPAKTQAEAISNVRLMFNESRQMSDHIAYSIDVSDLEVLPGVYDFSILDQVMDAASDHGCTVTIMLGHSESKHPFLWHPYTRTRNFDGSILSGHRYYGSFALTDESWMNSWKRAFHAIHTRYAQHPGFEGYYLMKPGGEWILPDEPWAGHISDYSWSSIQSFRSYLQKELKLDLTSLNQRWRTQYKNWDEVLPPQPDLQSGGKPDLRMQWTDFSNCKLYWNDSWTYELARDIRSYDTRRPILAYVRLMEEPVEKLAGLIDYQHNGGLHGFEAEGMLVDAWEKHKIGWITEPHFPHHWAWDHNGWVLDWSVFVMLSQAGGGGANLHIYYHPRENLRRYYPHELNTDSGPSLQRQEQYALAAHYGGAYAYDRFEHFKPILRELHNCKLDQTPKQVAVIHDRSTLLAKHRTTFRARLLDLSRWFDLLKQDSIDFEYYRQDQKSNYKLIVMNPLDEVITRDTLQTVTSAVRQGSWLVMGARTGAYIAEDPSAEFPLLTSFGITTPIKHYAINSDAQTATIEPAFQNQLQNVQFFTQREMKKRIANPELDYLNWAYRWMPQTDYYGIYPNQKIESGQIIACFPDGGVAVSLHSFGKGNVLVFWGTPDLEAPTNKGLMAAIAHMAGVTNPKAGNPIPHMLEASRSDLGRKYALLYQEFPGTYQQKIAIATDGEWFVDDMVSGDRYGIFTGANLREKGISLEFTGQKSPLKILRLVDAKTLNAVDWPKKYPLQPK